MKVVVTFSEYWFQGSDKVVAKPSRIKINLFIS